MFRVAAKNIVKAGVSSVTRRFASHKETLVKSTSTKFSENDTQFVSTLTPRTGICLISCV